MNEGRADDFVRARKPSHKSARPQSKKLESCQKLESSLDFAQHGLESSAEELFNIPECPPGLLLAAPSSESALAVSFKRLSQARLKISKCDKQVMDGTRPGICDDGWLSDTFSKARTCPSSLTGSFVHDWDEQTIEVLEPACDGFQAKR